MAGLKHDLVLRIDKGGVLEKLQLSPAGKATSIFVLSGMRLVTWSFSRRVDRLAFIHDIKTAICGLGNDPMVDLQHFTVLLGPGDLL